MRHITGRLCYTNTGHGSRRADGQTTMKRKWLSGLLLGLGGAALALAMWFGEVPRGLDNYPWLWRVRTLAKPSPATGQIKLLMLDQNSLDWGKNENSWSWPWPREVYGVLLDFCQRAGAKSVAFDVLFTEPSVYGVNDDLALGDAIRRSPPFVGALYLSDKQGEYTNWPAAVPARTPLFQGLES